MTIEGFAGNDYDIGIALQSAQGVAAAASQYRFYVTGGGVNPVKDVNPIEETTAQRLLADDYVAGIRAEGGPQLVARPKIAALLLYGAMGAKAVAGAGDPYTHTMTLAPRLPYFTLWTRLADSTDGLFTKIVDAKIASLNIESAANGLLMMTPSFVGTTPTHQDAAEAAATVEVAGTAFLHADGVGQFKVEGSAVATIENISVLIDNGVALHTGDSVTPYAALEARQTITLTATQLVQDFDLWRRFLYGAANPADNAAVSRAILEAGAGSVDFKWEQPVTPERSIQLVAPRVHIVPATVEANVNGDPLKYAVEYRVRQHATLSSLSAMVMNNVASYPVAGA